MKGNISNLQRRFCLDGTILGLKYFYLFPDKISRFFWFVWVAVVLYFAGLITYLLYQRFEALPTRINIENQFEPVTQLPYPAITLCSPNQLTISAVDHFDKTLVNGNRSYDLTSQLRQLLGFYYFTFYDLEQLTHLQELIELNRYTMPEVMKQLSQNCDEFLRLCVFGQQLYPHCRGLFKPVITLYGVCCAFSVYYYETHRRNRRNESFKPYLVSKAGVHHGLTVVTDYQPDDALDYTVQFSGATRILFTDWTEFPTEDESLLLSSESESFHLIRATATYCSVDVLALPTTSRKCLLEDERQLPFFHSYRNSDCDLLCLARAVQHQCGCDMLHLPRLRISEACAPTDIPCIKQVKLSLNTWQSAGECECPRDCDSRHYRVDTSVGNLRGLSDMFYCPYDGLKFNQSTSIMHFAFRTGVYEKQKQEIVMSITTLFSNLGGVFGLCLGCSALSVLEVLFYCYSAAKTCAARRRRPRRNVALQYRE